MTDQTTQFKIVDRKTGRDVHVGDVLVRRDYKGFRHKYEVIELVNPRASVRGPSLRGELLIRVRKLERERWVYLTMPLRALQLDEVML